MKNKVTIEYTFEQIGIRKYRVVYSAHDTEGTININNADAVYRPFREFKNNNEIRNGCYKFFSNLAKRAWDFTGSVSIICCNPNEDFLPLRWKHKKTNLQAPKIVELPLDKPMGPVEPNACVYEVVQVDGVWTIIRHAEPYYTQEQAKVELFKRIVNG